MVLYSLIFLFGILFIASALLHLQQVSGWPVVRGALEATWPMGPGHLAEGFQNSMPLEKWLPTPESLVKPSPDDCPPALWSAAAYQAGKIIPNYNLIDSIPSKQLNLASGPTAQKCYEVDWSSGLETSSYAQRTNNYKRGYPDSCSAPNHDLVLDFYKEKPMEGPYQL